MWRLLCQRPNAFNELFKINAFGVVFRFGIFLLVLLKSFGALNGAKNITQHSPIPVSRIKIESNVIKNKFNLPIRNHSPFVIKLEMSPPSSDFNTKSSCFVQIKHHPPRQSRESRECENRKQKKNVLFYSYDPLIKLNCQFWAQIPKIRI